jgi:two-component system, response regulator PdtaR
MIAIAYDDFCTGSGIRTRMPFRADGFEPSVYAIPPFRLGAAIVANMTVDRLVHVTTAAPRRVLIAEDEALIRLDLKEMLAESGYDVVGEASDGQQAVDLANALRPDLVILDVKMPGLDGISAAEQIVEAALAPVIMLTAFSQRELVERAADAGAMAYLVKPFDKSDLVPAIEVAISRHQQLRALVDEVADLSERLDTRKLLDRAKGKLQAERGMTEPDAFRWIQKTSMDRRSTMREVAEAVLATGDRAG